MPVAATHRNRNAAYDAPGFSDLWLSAATLKDIAAHYGVSYVAIHQAARRRGFPARKRGVKPAMKKGDE